MPDERRIPRFVTEDAVAGEAFFDDAVKRGHEGVMVKSLSVPYEAGRRGSGWVKVKQTHTLDLIVLAAEWGHGRRTGWLSNLHLGARDEETGEFVMLGKTFKGLTDELLRWQTERFQQLEVSRDDYTVYLRPGDRGGDRVRRRPDVDPLPGRDGAAVRPGAALSRGQDPGGSGHCPGGPRDPSTQRRTDR